MDPSPPMNPLNCPQHSRYSGTEPERQSFPLPRNARFFSGGEGVAPSEINRPIIQRKISRSKSLDDIPIQNREQIFRPCKMLKSIFYKDEWLYSCFDFARGVIQQNRVEEAIKLSHLLEDEELQKDALCMLGEAMFAYAKKLSAQHCFRTALKCYVKAEHIYEKLDQKDPRVQGAIYAIHYEMVACFCRIGRYQDSLKVVEDISNQSERSHLLFGMAREMAQVFCFEEAYECYLKIYQASCSKEERGNRAVAAYEMGMSLYALGKFDEALKYLEQARGIFKELGAGYLQNIPHALNGIGLCLNTQKRYREALESFEQALKIQKDRIGIGENHLDTARSFSYIGTTHSLLGKHQLALDYHTKAMTIRAKRLGKSHPTTAYSLENMAICFYGMKNFQQASTYSAQAYNILKRILPSVHPGIAAALNSHSVICRELNQKTASKHRASAKQIWEKHLKHHPFPVDAFVSVEWLQNFGQVFSKQELEQRTLGFAVAPPPELEWINDLQDVGKQLVRERRFTEAFALVKELSNKGEQRALLQHIAKKMIEQNVLEYALKQAGDYADKSLRREAIRALYYALGDRTYKMLENGRFDQASDQYKKMHEIFQEHLSEVDHEILEEIGMCLSYAEQVKDDQKSSNAELTSEDIEELQPHILFNAALKMADLKRFDKAVKCYELALKTLENTSDAKDINRANIMYGLGCSLMELGKYDKALEMLKKSLEIREGIVGNDDIDVACSISFDKIGKCLDKLGKEQEAQEYYEKSLTIRKKLFPKDPSVLMKAEEFHQKRLKNLRKDLGYYWISLTFKLKRVGVYHKETATLFFKMAKCLKKLEKFREALLYHKKALKIRQEKLGESHLDTANSLKEVGNCLASLGKLIKANEYYTKELRIRRSLSSDLAYPIR